MTPGDHPFNCCEATLEQYKCNMCPNFATNFLTSMMLHIQKGHCDMKRRQEPPRRCQKCNFQSYSEYMFAIHCELDSCTVDQKCKHELIWNHFDPTDIECLHCPFKFNIPKELQEYLNRRCGIETRPDLKCAHCPFKTFWKSSLRKHLQIKHTKCEPCHSKFLKCDYCPFQTKWSRSLPRHIKRKHSKFIKAKNVRKGTVFGQDIFTSLEAKKYTIEDDSFKCEHCPFGTKSKAYLKEHQRRKHTDLSKTQWFHCEHCPFETIDKSNLKKHHIRKHTDPAEIQWFHCEQCLLKFKLKTDLQQHMKIHENLRSLKKGTVFNCDFCAYKAYKRSNLRRHIVSKHTKVEQSYYRVKEDM